MDPFQAKLIAAATGSAVTAVTMTPFDVVKTRLQTQPPHRRPLFPKPPPNTCCQPSNAAPCIRNMSSLARPIAGDVVCLWDHGVLKTQRVNGFYDAVRHLWKVEGLAGLWKGTGTTLIIGVPASTAYILTYDYLLNTILPPFMPQATSVALPLCAGVLARSSIATVTSPLELIRTNLQSTPLSSNNPHTLSSVLKSVRRLVQTQGVLSLWRGLAPTLWRDVPFSGYYWASYELWKKSFKKHGHEGAWIAFISGAISGTSAALITSPFDTLKTRRQALVMSPIQNGPTGTMSLLMHILRTEGTSALFAGIGPRMAKIAPACGIMIACYEGIGRTLTQP
ncbi:mitochondrial carrier [Coprinopsis marcescibilis]|uniref:Mitochondrial carrier n=1 Tax=Coprinopsis marcescibilis TaxID=230819 RepID=A0A5C3LBQ7_COPMA|nr:mitochondrial carrier [Coprinopsis marcescibilis]